MRNKLRVMGFETLPETMVTTAPASGDVVPMKWGVCPWSARLRMRPLTPEDLDRLLLIFGDPRAMQFWPRVKTREEIAHSIATIRQSYRANGYGLWAAELKESGEFVGRVGLIRQEDVNGRAEVEVAYSLIPHFWHLGYATEAARACRDWAFENLACARVVSLVGTNNVPSCRVAERNGMRIEAQTTHSNLLHNVYAITRAQWETAWRQG